MTKRVTKRSTGTTSRTDKKIAKKTPSKQKTIVIKKSPSNKELKAATKKVMKQYSAAIKNLARR